MHPPAPILVTPLFPEILDELLTLLSSLTAEEWEQPTNNPGWTVKDIATHLLGGDVGILSRKRDGYRQAGGPIANWDELVAFVNSLNDAWMKGARRISPRLLCDLLRFICPQVCDYFASLDLYAMGDAVSWAGPQPAPVWLDVAREYTERWHHQQQLRDAVGKPGLMQPRYLHPALDAFVRALPHTFRDVAAEDGTAVILTITGAGGGAWSLMREGGGWQLYVGKGDKVSSEVTIDEDTGWRLFTKGISVDAAGAQARISGDQQLGEQALNMVSVIA
jgi:uncharacterized protein (TIGR03083 family)